MYTANASKTSPPANPDIFRSAIIFGGGEYVRKLAERQEAGVKVTVVTWHPDSYVYGRDEHRIELMEVLRNAGVNIELVRDHCEHYAVIDNEIVWYGSMNLLSKDDIEDNIMRVVSKQIAAELLEMTFKKGNSIQQYVLPFF